MLRLIAFVLFNTAIVMVLVRPNSRWTWALVLAGAHVLVQMIMLLLID